MGKEMSGRSNSANAHAEFKAFLIPGFAITVVDTNGLQRSIDAYLAEGGQEVSKNDVHVHEFLLGLNWYESLLTALPAAKARGIIGIFSEAC